MDQKVFDYVALFLMLVATPLFVVSILGSMIYFLQNWELSALVMNAFSILCAMCYYNIHGNAIKD